MPQVDVDGLTINYDVQGEGETVLLIPYTSADHACYAFQLPAYTEHFRCIAIDLPGSGESSTPPGPYSHGGLRRPGRLLPRGDRGGGRTLWACPWEPLSPCTWGRATRARCARCPCTAAGTPPMPILRAVVEQWPLWRRRFRPLPTSSPRGSSRGASPQRCTPKRPDFVDSLVESSGDARRSRLTGSWLSSTPSWRTMLAARCPKSELLR